MTFCAIMSISLVVNLPGLAVTPMLGTLHKIFPGTGQTEDQMLTVLPNLLIIPFVLLSGKLSLARHKILIVVFALVLFTACAVAYLFASSMMQLIIISCLLGCGAGLLIPFSTGLIADTFSGNYRLKEMGVQSGISNTTVMAATFAVGWLCHGNWHLPFVVYLVAIIPLGLSFWLKGLQQNDTKSADTEQPCTDNADEKQANTAKKNILNPDSCKKVIDGFYVGRILSLIGVYFFITFATISISYYCPFLIEKKDWSDSLSGTITAIYFLFIFIPGYTLPWFVKIFKGNLFFLSSAAMTVGISLFAFIPSPATMCVGAALAGLGYGICQPMLYDKASLAVTSGKKATLSLAFVLSANYIAIVAAPFIIDLARIVFHAGNVTGFAFIVCAILLVAFTIISYLRRHSFAFSVSAD